MRILLVDVDSKIPNIALGRISTYYKNKKHNVDYIKLGFNGYPTKKKIKTINASDYNRVFVSIIFTINQQVFKIEGCKNVLIGGPGSKNMKMKLPKKIDICEVDYILWPDNDTSYGFITKGCIRKCYFCFVPKMEGGLHFNKSIDEIIRHKKVSFMDNNFLAYCKHKEILRELIKRNIKCVFNQGLDIRLIDEVNAELLSKLRYISTYIFAFDDIKNLQIIERKLIIIKKYISKPWQIRFYIYHNAENNNIKDLVFRIEWCRENQCLPYFMRDQNCWFSKYKKFYIDLASYCNQPGHFKSTSFSEYLIKRHLKNKNRYMSSRRIYEANRR